MSIPDFKFPQTLKIKEWEKYLERPLKFEERFLIEMCKSEKHMNKMLCELYKKITIKSNNYYIPILTKLDGNCLFESLNYFGIGKTVEEIRSVLSLIFYIFQDYKNFLPGMETTLSELFSFTNEVAYVSTKKDKNPESEKEYYKYSYNIMCQDIGNLTCWSRLPTQLILLVISYLFKVEINIIHSNTGHETVINAYENIINNNTKKIYLGLLGESHYVVLDINNNSDTKPQIYYDEAKNNLIKFGNFIENKKKQKYEESIKPKEDNNITFSEIKTEECIDDNVNFT